MGRQEPVLVSQLAKGQAGGPASALDIGTARTNVWSISFVALSLRASGGSGWWEAVTMMPASISPRRSRRRMLLV